MGRLAGGLLLGAMLLGATLASATIVTVGALPSPRTGATAVAFDGAVYVIGGRSGAAYLDEIVRVTPESGASEVVARLPLSASGTAGRQSATALAIGDRIYVFGGAALMNAGDLNGDGEDDWVPRSIDDIVEFDPATRNVRKLPDVLPSALWGVSSIVRADFGYLFGGFTFDISDLASIARHDSILAFDPHAPDGGRVARLPLALPFRVQDAATVRHGADAYRLGGLSDNNTANPCPLVETANGTLVHQSVCATDRIVRVDLEAMTASIVGALPARTQFASAAEGNGTIHILGGRGSDSEASESVWTFEPASGVTTVSSLTLPTPRYGVAIAHLGEDAYLSGGRDSSAHANGMSGVLRVRIGLPTPGPPPRPDLRAESLAISVERSHESGLTCHRFHAEILNAGAGSSPPSAVRFGLDASAPVDVPLPALAPGGATIISSTWCRPLLQGRHDIRATADPHNATRETREDNNAISGSFEVSYVGFQTAPLTLPLPKR